jgi:integrase/recombinase XerD
MPTVADRRSFSQSLPPLADVDALAIERFIDAIWAERGLAAASLAAYRSDLQGLARWAIARAPVGDMSSGLVHSDRSTLFDYFAMRTNAGYTARSNARLLSSLRAFHAHCVRRGERQDDPTALLQPPSLPRSLPKALSEAQVEALLTTPDVATGEGMRDRAMLELMYACGLRVSELVELPATALNLRQGVLRVRGKGGKERLVPLGEESQHWLQRYLAWPHARCRGAVCRWQGPRADPPSVLVAGQAQRGAGGDRSLPNQSARAAPQFRHPSAQPRRGPASAADAAGP